MKIPRFLFLCCGDKIARRFVNDTIQQQAKKLPLGFHSRPQAVALVIVLAMMGLMTLLVVGFMVRVGSARKAVASYSATARTRQLANTVTNLVQAQVNEATSRCTGSITQGGSGFGWVSQPGALRLFDGTGALKTIYRLYSSTSLTGTSASDFVKDIPPEDWADSPAIWTDLNAPMPDTAGNLHFPILDPRDPNNSTSVINVDGFALDKPPGATINQPAPMPTRWLYILQNGEIITSSITRSAGIITIGGARKDNPVIGRIAFWTDDETCKVNINTAAGDGINNLVSNTTDNTADKTFWDTPHFVAPDELKLDSYAPTAGEYQRYPGHPATTALKKIFTDLGYNLSSPDFYQLLPRYNDGGSKGGTLSILNAAKVPAKTNPLYSSVGEMLFTPDRLASALNMNDAVSSQRIDTAKFFLTTNSRAPEINLFGLPRISIWPLSSNTDASHRSTVDQLMAFCSTIGTKPYYFSRQDPTNAITDINLTRNTDLLSYVDRLTTQAVPGFGGNFDTKYPATPLGDKVISERRQILTEIFDYIRTTNLHDATVSSPFAAAGPNITENLGEGQVIPCSAGDGSTLGWNTQGFGRFFRLREVSLQFVAMGAGQSGSNNAIPVQSAYASMPGVSEINITGGVLPANTTAVQAFLLFSIFDPSMGYSWIMPNVYFDISGLENLTITDGAGTIRPLGFAASGNYTPAPMGGPGVIPFKSMNSGSNLGGLMDFRCILYNRILTHAAFPAGLSSQGGRNYPFYSAITAIPNSSSITLNGATIKVNIYGPSGAGTPVQSYDISFNSVSFPMPQLATGAATGPLIGTNNDSDRWKDNFSPANWIGQGDIVKSVIPNTGDVRLLALNKVPSSAFVPYKDYQTTSRAHGYGMVQNASATMSQFLYSGATVGALVSGASYYAAPIVPASLNGAVTSGGSVGDWDNGIGTTQDGPYINKPDEGNIKTTLGQSYYVTYSDTQPGSTLFAPNRQVPSPVMFGSLSTGVIHQLPWQTLLFRPGPGLAGLTYHPGESGRKYDGSLLTDAPPDHLLLDLFWMPSVSPYAISEPFSTAGKINLNYQIVPFTYINRSSALRSVLASEKIAVIGKNDASQYKKYVSYGGGQGMQRNARIPIDISETLKQFDKKFRPDGDIGNGSLFRSASEICDMFLIPQGYTLSDFPSKWYGDDFALVGDNVRERPYANIYSRVTTKSNTYIVHFTVQALKNVSTDATQWDETRGAVIGEYRGSSILERYLDPNDSNLTNSDFASSTASILESFYKWRVVRNSRFSP
ncbi:MAG: Verru_Chthon cassette protein A [Chthoniobacteraceae bacterium]